ncbi:hypothetical protein [Microbacterium sufflavum]|uniref:IgA FC receptor n=1 Tax=Microbacterium sufflavum TaxID=2851649 RepID=A0ABY4IF36_9MICO|nr:hypothetical protein [Microbacterium sufflavum]UPL10280.1 hypothetical protein KV394_03780 [Microbacterium sufflavum]
MSDPQQPAESAPVPPAPTPPLTAEPRYPAAPPPGYPSSAPSFPHPAASPAAPASTTAAPAAPGATANPYATAPSAAPDGTPYPPAYPTAVTPGGPGYPQFPVGTPPRTAADRGSSLGRVAFIVAVVVFALDLLLILGRPFLYMGDRGYSLIGFVEGASSVVGFLGYAVALVLGIVAARRPGSRLFAGIAIGISGAGLLGIVTVWLASMFYRFV